MRVLQLYTSTRPFFEGQLDALADRGVDCTAVGVPGEYAPDAPRSATDYLRYLPRVLGHSLSRYDLVHANYGLTAPFALAQPTRPVVLTLWGSDLMSDRRWLTALSRAGARAADAVILPSRAMAGDLPADARIVPFGVDTDRFRPMPREAAREQLGWATDERVVLFPYDPDRPEKDHPRAERVLAAADVDATLRVVTGVPHEAMPLYLNASDALLVTSRRESGPMVIKEAAACDVPVVSTDVGFVRETLAGVEGARICRSDEELIAGLEATLADGSRPDARAQVGPVGLDAMGERLAAVYESVAGGGARA